MRTVCLNVQMLPTGTIKLARLALLQLVAKQGVWAHTTAAVLSALDLLDIDQQTKLLPSSLSTIPRSVLAVTSSSSIINNSSQATKLIDLSYDSKAQLLNKLLNKVTLPINVSAVDATCVTNAAEIILSKTVLILQYNVVLHPYQIFVLRKFSVNESNDGMHWTVTGCVHVTRRWVAW